MTTTIASFTQAANQAQQWVNELSEELGWDERRALRLLRSVLHTLRDWLPEAEVADFAAQLPVLVRGIYFEGWKPPAKRAGDRRKTLFIERIRDDLSNEPPGDPERAIIAVFSLLDRHLDQGEITQVRNSMKKQLRELWPAH